MEASSAKRSAAFSLRSLRDADGRHHPERRTRDQPGFPMSAEVPLRIRGRDWTPAPIQTSTKSSSSTEGCGGGCVMPAAVSTAWTGGHDAIDLEPLSVRDGSRVFGPARRDVRPVSWMPRCDKPGNGGGGRYG